jgi:hypothetical protein
MTTEIIPICSYVDVMFRRNQSLVDIACDLNFRAQLQIYRNIQNIYSKYCLTFERSKVTKIFC